MFKRAWTFLTVVYVAAMAAVCCLVVLGCLCKSFIEFTVSYFKFKFKENEKVIKI